MSLLRLSALVAACMACAPAARGRGPEPDPAPIRRAVESILEARGSVVAWLPPFGVPRATVQVVREVAQLAPPICATVESLAYEAAPPATVSAVADHCMAALARRAAAAGDPSQPEAFQVHSVLTLEADREARTLTWIHHKGTLPGPGGQRLAVMQTGTIAIEQLAGRVRVRVSAQESGPVPPALERALREAVRAFAEPFLAPVYPGAKAQGGSDAFPTAARQSLVTPAPRVSDVLDWHQERLTAGGLHGRLVRTERRPTGERPGTQAPDGSIELSRPDGVLVQYTVTALNDGSLRIEARVHLQRVPPRELPRGGP